MAETRSIKLLIWMDIPSHHQSAFFKAIREAGVDLVVHYFSRISKNRQELGWSETEELYDEDRFIEQYIKPEMWCEDWRERAHIVTGCGYSFLRKLVRYLSKEKIKWFHWSECSLPGIRRLFGYVIKHQHAKMVNKYSSGAFATGQTATNDFICWGIRQEKIHFLPYAVDGLKKSDTPDIAIETFVASRKLIFTYIGAMVRRKGVDILLKAFREVVSQQPDVCLVLVGKDMKKERYKKFSNQLGLKDHVLFRGVVPAEHINRVLQSTDVLILPSRHDGWGMVLNEGASMGKALIATKNCGSAHHIIINDKNGYCIKPNVSSLVKAMKHYACDHNLAERHGKKSLEIFKDFTPLSNANRLKAYLMTL